MPWNGSTKNLNAALASPASSPMKPPSCAWSPPCSTNSATNGKPPKFTSTWKTVPSPQFDATRFYRKKFAPPVYGWCTDGVRMVYGWCTDGVRMVYGWCTHGVRMVYAWCTHGVRMVYAWCTDGVRIVYGWCT